MPRSSINIMEICYISARCLFGDYRPRHRFPQAENSRPRAETENLPAKSRSGSGLRKLSRVKKKKGRYSICSTGTFHTSWVTSEPTSLQDKPHIQLNTSKSNYEEGISWFQEGGSLRYP